MFWITLLCMRPVPFALSATSSITCSSSLLRAAYCTNIYSYSISMLYLSGASPSPPLQLPPPLSAPTICPTYVYRREYRINNPTGPLEIPQRIPCRTHRHIHPPHSVQLDQFPQRYLDHKHTARGVGRSPLPANVVLPFSLSMYNWRRLICLSTGGLHGI